MPSFLSFELSRIKAFIGKIGILQWLKMPKLQINKNTFSRRTNFFP